MTTTPLEDFAARDGDLGGTKPAPFEQRDLSPIIREQKRLIAQIAEVTDATPPDPTTWEDVQVIARLAENGMATQAAEHATELRRAWTDGRAAGMSDSREANPYPEITPASAQAAVDIYGEPVTWHQLPHYVAALHAKIRALAEVQS